MIRDNIQAVKRRVSSLCSRLQKDPNAVIIIAVSKERSVEEIQEAVAGGLSDIGENRVQEALAKHRKLVSLRSPSLKLRRTVPQGFSDGGQAVTWHMVGHLQTNKVKDAVKIFDLIHSVDSVKLAAEIDKEAAKINKTQDILIQVNTSFEETKFGIRPAEVIPVVLEVAGFRHVNVTGLMTIAPVEDNPEKVRPYFKALRELRNKLYELRVTDYELRILSMGMTDDFEVAIEEGATMVRIGRGIFGVG